MPQPYILATSCAEPDREFETLHGLARYIVALRDKHAARPDMVAVEAYLARSDLPGGRTVSVRMLDGSNGGKGALIGYAFMPLEPHAREPLVLMAAIVAVQKGRAAA